MRCGSRSPYWAYGQRDTDPGWPEDTGRGRERSEHCFPLCPLEAWVTGRRGGEWEVTSASHPGAICSLTQTPRLSGQARTNDWGRPATKPGERGRRTHEVIRPMMYGPEKSWVNDLRQGPA